LDRVPISDLDQADYLGQADYLDHETATCPTLLKVIGATEAKFD
jgi:hypothetical protein